jgi:deoxyadenosine/deoxycytidine kinase
MYEDAEVFARNLFMQGQLSARDYRVYRDLYQVFVSLLPPPDLVVYLRASLPTLRHRINQRARRFEQNIPDSYLQGLGLLYEDWIGSFQMAPVLAIETDELDFSNHAGDLEAVVARIEKALREGQEELDFPKP